MLQALQGWRDTHDPFPTFTCWLCRHECLTQWTFVECVNETSVKGRNKLVRSERVQMKKGRHTPFSINMLIESHQPSKHQSSFCDWARIVDRKKHSTGVEGRARTQGFKPELIHHEILIRMVFHRSQLSKKACFHWI